MTSIFKLFGILVHGDLQIVATPRIHLGLISMHSRAHRKNGGVGFSIAEPKVTIDIKAGHTFSIRDDRQHPFSKIELHELHKTIESSFHQESRSSGPAVRISGSMQTHVGMGSGTAIRLAIIEGVHLYFKSTASRTQLVELSRRGGTSGVGTATYFSGGLALDLGRLNDGSPIVPSSQANRGYSPITLPPIAMPDWPLCLCIPNAIRPKTQDEEAEFFSRIMPLTAAASHRACYEAVFGVYASVHDQNYDGFCRAVSSMQNTEWKMAEWIEYGESLRILETGLKQLGADCVGMSSLGPMLFCFGDQPTLRRIESEQHRIDCTVYKTRPNNSGRQMCRLGQCES